MASQWRGGPYVKGTLGTLLRTTMHQVGVVRDAARETARTQRVWIDSAMLARRRRELLADIGAKVVDRVRAGGFAERARFPELTKPLDELDALEEELAEASARSRDSTGLAGAAVSMWRGDSSSESGPEPARRAEELRVWRPHAQDAARAPASEDDDTPGSRPGARGERRKARVVPQGGGGIAFADAPPSSDPEGDADLEEYMHEDDVPGGEPSR